MATHSTHPTHVDPLVDFTDPGRPETDRQTVKEPEGDSELSRSRRVRRGYMTWRLVVAFGLVAAVAGVFYAHVTDAAADNVILRWHQSPPVCDGVEIRSSGDDETFLVPDAMVVTKSFACTITIEVLNNSGHTVHLDHALATGLGPGTGAVVKVDPTHHPQSGHTSDLDRDRGTQDAYIEINGDPGGSDVPADQDASFDINLVFNPAGCNIGGTTWIDGWPQVTFTILGREFTRSAADTIAFTQQGRSPGCRDL